MIKTRNPELRYRTVWLVLGYLLIALVVYLSLTSSPVAISVGLPYQDKLLHGLAYFSLTFWFLQIYHFRHQVVLLVILIFGLGLLLEYLQAFGSSRYSEAGDMLANVIGICAAAALARTRLRFVLVRLESYLR